MMKPHYIYDIDELAPVHLMILYGLQWAIILFPALVITASLCGQALQLSAPQSVRFLQLTLLASGLFTAIQTIWGHRYPLIEGPSTALLLTTILLAHYGIGVIRGGAIVAAVILAAVVLTGLLPRVVALVTPNVVGVILILIGLTLLPHLIGSLTGVTAEHPQGDPLTALLSFFLILVITGFSYWFKGFWKTLAVFIGMILGSFLFWMLGRIDWIPIRTASWFSLPAPWASWSPRFSWAAILSFCFAYLALTVNTLGSLQGVAGITDMDRLPRATSHGLLVNALSGICCGMLGIVGTVSYSSSPGVLLVNRVASRFALTYCGIILVLAAFIPKLASLLDLIPNAVVSATLCVAMGGQVGAGLAIISAGGPLTSRSYFVVGVPLIVGTLAGFLPSDFLLTLPGGFRVLAGNGLIIGILLVLFLEHVLLRQGHQTEELDG